MNAPQSYVTPEAFKKTGAFVNLPSLEAERHSWPTSSHAEKCIGTKVLQNKKI